MPRAVIDEPAYAYLLGLYLGDGWISCERRTYRLRVGQDMRYRDLITLAQRTMERVRGRGGRAGTAPKIGCIEIYATWNHWPCLFPQHGVGRKHLRPILLDDWQKRIVGVYPRQLLRQIFRNACDALSIRYRNSKPTTISIARRQDVAMLDAFIGPKS